VVHETARNVAGGRRGAYRRDCGNREGEKGPGSQRAVTCDGAPEAGGAGGRALGVARAVDVVDVVAVEPRGPRLQRLVTALRGGGEGHRAIRAPSMVGADGTVL